MRKIECNNSDRITVSWFPLLHCNYHCSYCFMTSQLSNKKKYNNSLSKILKFLKLHNNIKLDILGGEPFLIDNLEEIVEKCCEICEVTVFTNGKYIRKIDERAVILISIHFEYLNEKYIENILKKIKKLKNHFIISFNYSINANINEINKYMIVFREQGYFTEINFIYDEENYLKYDFENIINQIDCKEFLDSFNIKLNNQKISYIDYLKINPKNFKNCLCFLNTFSIDYDLNVLEGCTNNILFNLNNEIKPLKIFKKICKLNYCITQCTTETNRTLLK